MSMLRRVVITGGPCGGKTLCSAAVKQALGDDAILVAEVACAVPGCPPVETVIAFWMGGLRRHFKIFKPVAQIENDDLPPVWMRRALAVSDDFQCDCC